MGLLWSAPVGERLLLAPEQLALNLGDHLGRGEETERDRAADQGVLDRTLTALFVDQASDQGLGAPWNVIGTWKITLVGKPASSVPDQLTSAVTIEALAAFFRP